MLVLVSNGFFVGSPEQNFLLQTLQIFVIYFTIAVVCVPMVYRYLAVCRCTDNSIMNLNPLNLDNIIYLTHS